MSFFFFLSLNLKKTIISILGGLWSFAVKAGQSGNVWGHDGFSLSSSPDHFEKVKRKSLFEVETHPFRGNQVGQGCEGSIQDIHQREQFKEAASKTQFLCKYTEFKLDVTRKKKLKKKKQIIVISKKYPFMCYSSMENDYLLCGRLFVWELFLTAAVGERKETDWKPTTILLTPSPRS